MEKQITIEMNYVILFILLWACFGDSEKRVPLMHICLPIILFFMWLLYNEYKPTVFVRNNNQAYTDDHADTRKENWEKDENRDDDMYPLVSYDTRGSKYAKNENKKNDYMRRHRMITQHREATAPLSRRRGMRPSYTTHTRDDDHE